jgi:hypothetical protein
MSDLIAQIQMAQRDAGERAVIAHLQRTMGKLREDKDTMNNGRDCAHGQLDRSCDRCADAAEIAELRAEVVRLREQEATDLRLLQTALKTLVWETGSEGLFAAQTRQTIDALRARVKA